MNKGAFVFCADLIRYLHIPLRVEFVKISTYKGKMKTKAPVITDDVQVSGEDIIIVDEIIDSGETLLSLKKYFMKNGANSVKLCVLLVKENETRKVAPDYYGFNITDVFVAGYGLDYNERYRELPYIIEV